VLTQDITPIGEVAPALARWGSFFQRALSKDPTGRFQSAHEMSQAIAAIMAGSSSAQGRDGGTVAIAMPGQGAPATQGPHQVSPYQGQRPGLAQGTRSPAVEVFSPPPVGVPWWVVGAVGGACFLLGFIAGYVAH
jgi:hypothetical protein